MLKPKEQDWLISLSRGPSYGSSPTLNRLLRRGLVRIRPTSPQAVLQYEITDAGRAALDPISEVPTRGV